MDPEESITRLFLLIDDVQKEYSRVAAYDPFFEGVREVGSVDEFIEAVSEDRVLSEADVATYIRSVVITPDSAIALILDESDKECISRLGHPLYDPDKKDCPTAHVLDRSISANRIRAATDGWEMLRIINSVLEEYEPVPMPIPSSDRAATVRSLFVQEHPGLLALGQERPVVRMGRRRGVPARRPRCAHRPDRQRPLRPREPVQGDRRRDPGLLRTWRLPTLITSKRIHPSP